MNGALTHFAWRITALSAGVGCWLAAAPLRAEAIAESASQELLTFVMGQVTNVSTPVIAVMPFRHEDGSKSMEGELLAERVLTALTAEAGVRVVERKHLDDALAEQKLGAEGFLAPETAAHTGRLTGANLLLAGTLTPMGDLLEIHARLFAVETGTIVAAREVRARRSIRTFINPLWDDIDRIKAAGKTFDAELWLDQDRLRIGDTAQVRFRVTRDCHVTLFNFATDGSITVLFPNRFQPDNRARAGRTYAVPGEEGGYKIRTRGPAGVEHLKLFATTTDVPLFVRDYAQAPFGTVDDGDQEFVRGLQLSLDGLPEPDWAETTCEFLIENVLR